MRPGIGNRWLGTTTMAATLEGGDEQITGFSRLFLRLLLREYIGGRVISGILRTPRSSRTEN
jgi:hypothetical protein